MERLYEGYMTCECVWHDTLQYTFYLEDCIVESVDITYRGTKLESIEWYTTTDDIRHVAQSIEETPLMWHNLFRKLNNLIEEGETELDFFVI